jgi:hypothetical protein
LGSWATAIQGILSAASDIVPNFAFRTTMKEHDL